MSGKDFYFTVKQTGNFENGFIKCCVDLSDPIPFAITEKMLVNKIDGLQMCEVHHQDKHICTFFESSLLTVEQAKINLVKFIRDSVSLFMKGDSVNADEVLNQGIPVKRPEEKVAKLGPEKQIDKLRANLEKLVANEQYEEAVIIRDRITKLINEQKSEGQKK